MSREILEDLREADHYGRIPESLIYDKEAPHTAIRFYGVLDRHLNKKTKTCYPGFRRINKLTGMGMTTISNALEYLKKAGYLRVLKFEPQAGQYAKNHYQLMEFKSTTATETGAVRSRNGSREPLPNQEHNQSSLTKDKIVADATSSTENFNTFKTWWVESWPTEFKLPKYFFQGGKDAKTIERLVGSFSVETLKKLVRQGWATPDQKGFSTRKVCSTIAGFSSMVNQLAVAPTTSTVKTQTHQIGGPVDIGWLERTRKERAEEERRKAAGSQ